MITCDLDDRPWSRLGFRLTHRGGISRFWRIRNNRTGLQDTVTLYLEIFQPHRQFANALPGGVENPIADRRIGPDIGQFADSLNAGRIDMIVLLGEHDDL